MKDVTAVIIALSPGRCRAAPPRAEVRMCAVRVDGTGAGPRCEAQGEGIDLAFGDVYRGRAPVGRPHRSVVLAGLPRAELVTFRPAGASRREHRPGATPHGAHPHCPLPEPRDSLAAINDTAASSPVRRR